MFIKQIKILLLLASFVYGGCMGTEKGEGKRKKIKIPESRDVYVSELGFGEKGVVLQVLKSGETLMCEDIEHALIACDPNQRELAFENWASNVFKGGDRDAKTALLAFLNKESLAEKLKGIVTFLDSTLRGGTKQTRRAVWIGRLGGQLSKLEEETKRVERLEAEKKSDPLTEALVILKRELLKLANSLTEGA